MTCNNAKLELVNMNAYIEFGENMLIGSLDIEWKRNFGVHQDTNVGKMMCNNPTLDLVNMMAYIKFGEILSICSQDIEGKQKFGINQGP